MTLCNEFHDHIFSLAKVFSNLCSMFILFRDAMPIHFGYMYAFNRKVKIETVGRTFFFFKTTFYVTKRVNLYLEEEILRILERSNRIIRPGKRSSGQEQVCLFEIQILEKTFKNWNENSHTNGRSSYGNPRKDNNPPPQLLCNKRCMSILNKYRSILTVQIFFLYSYHQ